MLPRKALLPVAIAAGLVAALSAAASSQAADPTAHASGGGGGTPPPLPALVRTRVVRTENALERLTESVDDGDAVQAAKTAKVIRRQLSAAWRGTKYYIKNAPPAPPPADDARVHFNDDVVLHVKDLAPRVRARITGGAPAAGTIADPPTTTIAVFQVQDDVISTIVELTDGARVPLLDAMSTTLFYALDKRDAAVEDVHTLAPPAPPPADDARFHARAHASGGAVAGGTFDAVMPQVVGMIDDELQQIDALQSDATDLRPGAKKILRDAEAQALITQRQVNTYWPPAPPADD
jgi:hypothetical protein